MEKSKIIQPAKGMQDLLPARFAGFERITKTIRECFESFGFQPLELPIIEPLELHLVKTGAEVRSKMYVFKDKADRELCLRPELTASVVRAYNSSLKSEAKPVKVYYVGPAFRYDRPQKGRYRQFTHAGVEVFGAAGARAEAEIIYMAARALDMIGLKDYRLGIGNVGITLNLVERLGLDEDIMGVIIESLESLKKQEETIGQTQAKFRKMQSQKPERRDALRQVVDYIERAVGIKGKPGAVLGEVKKLVEDFQIGDEPLRQIEEVVEGLDCYGMHWERTSIDLGFGRGLEYYTSIVFEIECENLGAQKQVCGGGRYDDLVETFGGESTPAVGFAYGIERLVMALEKEEGSTQSKSNMQKGFTGVFVAPLDDDSLGVSLRFAEELRAAGLRVETDISFKNLKKCLRYAHRSGIGFAAIIGEEERKSSKVKIKDMKTGDERLFSISDIEAISGLLKAPAKRG